MKEENIKKIKLAAFIVSLVNTIFTAPLTCFISLAWMIPFTIKTYKIYKGTSDIDFTFFVFHTIFGNELTNILLYILLDEKSRYGSMFFWGIACAVRNGFSLPLAWIVPLTIFMFKKWEGEEMDFYTALLWTILMNGPRGVLMLIDTIK